MSSLRQYITKDIVSEITGVEILDNKFIEVAESLVDAYCKEELNWLNPNNQKAMHSDLTVESGSISFSESFATLTSVNTPLNHFQFTCLEFLSEVSTVKKGKRLAIKSSDEAGKLFFDEVKGLTGSAAVKIAQIGVFPRLLDRNSYGKSIPWQVIDAVAWQAAELQSKGQTAAEAVTANGAESRLKSENIGTSYSYAKKDSVRSGDTLCPQARESLATLFV